MPPGEKMQPPSGERTGKNRKKGFSALMGHFLLLFLLPAGNPGVSAQEKPLPGKSPVQEASLDSGELLLFQEIPLVVTTARDGVKPSLSPAPVSILSGEEIEWTGLTCIPELLLFLPGMDLARLDRIRYAGGVRGLHSFVADRTLCLIDGRNATHPAWGGTQYNFLPLMVEDLERVEVVRGPIGAAWGANAFNGAVNFITKRPEETQGTTLSGRIDEFGDYRGFLRWGSRWKDFFWRVSSSYERMETSSDALTGEDFDSNDSFRRTLLDARGEWKIEKGDTLSFGAAFGRNRTGDFPHMGFWPRKKGMIRNLRLFAKREFETPGGGSAYVQAFCNRESDDFPSEGRASSTEYDLEGQLTRSWIEGHKTTLGGNFRFTLVDPKDPRDPQEMRFLEDPIHEYWAGLFLSDQWTPVKGRTLEFQFRGDQYSGTGMDWSGRVSWLEELPGRGGEVLRLSLARSFRAPLSVFRRMEMDRFPLAGGGYAYHLEADKDLRNEEIHSLEAGFSARPADNLVLRADTYFQFLNDLIDAVQVSPGIYRFENSGRARAYGGELTLEWTTGPARLGVWYGYNGLHSHQDESFRSFRPTDHNAGAKALVDLSHGFRFSCFYRYADAVQTPGMHSLPMVHHLDAALGKELFGGRALFQVGVMDLLEKEAPKVYGWGNVLAFETPGRTFFARLSLSF